MLDVSFFYPEWTVTFQPTVIYFFNHLQERITFPPRTKGLFFKRFTSTSAACSILLILIIFPGAEEQYLLNLKHFVLGYVQISFSLLPSISIVFWYMHSLPTRRKLNSKKDKRRWSLIFTILVIRLLALFMSFVTNLSQLLLSTRFNDSLGENGRIADY